MCQVIFDSLLKLLGQLPDALLLLPGQLCRFLSQLLDKELFIADLADFTPEPFRVRRGPALWKRTLLINTITAVAVAAEFTVLYLLILFEDKLLTTIALCSFLLVSTGF